MALFNLNDTNAVSQARSFNSVDARIQSSVDVLFDANVSAEFVGLESASPSVEDASAFDAQFNSIKASLTTMDGFSSLGDVGLESAARAALMFGNCEVLNKELGKSKIVGLEACGQNDLLETRSYSIAAAGLLADHGANLSDFIYPPIEVGAKFGGIDITVERFVIEENQYHAATGTTTWERTHLADAAVREGLLGGGENRMYPVVTNSNKSNFVDAGLVPFTSLVHQDTTKFNTTYLLADETARNLITMSNEVGVRPTGQLNILDRINEAPTVESVLISLGTDKGTTANQAWALDLTSLAGAQFGRIPNPKDAADRVVSVHDALVTIDLVNGTSKTNGTGAAVEAKSLQIFAALIAAGVTSIKIAVSLSMQLNLHNGTFKQNPATFTVVDARLASKPNENSIAAVQSECDKIKPVYIGVKLNATLSSATMRIGGTPVGTEEIVREYLQSAHAPMTSNTEFTGATADVTLNVLTAAVASRRNEEAVVQLTNDFDHLLQEYGTSNTGSAYQDSSLLGLAFVAQPWVKEIEVDLKKLVAEDNSMNRRLNLQAAVMTQLSQEAAIATKMSNLNTVRKMYDPASNGAVTWGIVGDSTITRHLMIDGDDKAFGADNGAINPVPAIMSTNYESLADTLYMIPLKDSNTLLGHVLGFGFALNSSPVVVKTEIDRDNAKYKTLQIHPFYSLHTSTPVVVKVKFKNVGDFFKTKSYITMKTV